MIKNMLRYIIPIFVLLFIGCTSNEITYEKLVNDGLQSGERVDSLFLGYYLGMHRNDFHIKSWEMNREEKMTGITKIEYKFDGLKSRATMMFYPTFVDDKIAAMPVSYGYDAWAPWNEEFWPENLLKDLVEFYEKEYDTKFSYVKIPKADEYAYVSVEGNREIRMYKNSENTVMVEFIDLNVFNPLEIDS
jgi:hypothetical protein